ncbi:hypothetical protein OJF2_26620 [Aquisphaera giovannonii]|uniref:DUF8091 domain-containing protein n=1 Tax=Aquisphaera giovannonii TaxID=406548 RepID=A0A5B9W1J1_9BACT|nr:hypothetical protein [Aquisphaera giovannonii]QEH34127.1 hypothetical protein OJF2_26620 [Aquisphaera giovannonii]
MESSLHRALKDLYGDAGGGRSEVALDGFRVDAIDATGRVIEVQSASLGPLRAKLARLLPSHRIRVVKPVVVRKRIVLRAPRDGPETVSRRSSKRGTRLDVFDDLVGLARSLPDPNLSLEVVEVEIDEVRLPRRRRPGFAVADRRLVQVAGRMSVDEPSDLWTLLPGGWDWEMPFTTDDLARRLDRPVDFARRVAYCLRESGACVVVGKVGNRWVYSSRPLEAAAIAGPIAIA